MTRLFEVAVLTACCGACSSSPPAADAGTSIDGEVAEWRPEPPAAPAAPATPSRFEGVIAQPLPPARSAWADVTRVSCAPHEAQFAGDPSCAPIGPPCPEGDWAEELPSDRAILYVRPAEGSGGSGTREDPFTAIGAAIAAANPGTIVALARGSYEANVVLPTGVFLWGACVAETHVYSSEPAERTGVVSAGGTAAAVRNVRLGGARPGLSVGSGRELNVESVLIERAESFGAFVDGGRLTGGHLVVRDTQSRAGTLLRGRGISAEDGASVELERVVLERNRELGLAVRDPNTSVTIIALAVRDTRTRPDGEHGEGVDARDGAHLGLEGAVIESSIRAGLQVIDLGTTVTLNDVAIRDTRSSTVGTTRAGYGIYLGLQAALSARRLVIAESEAFGLIAVDEGTTLVLEDAIVERTKRGVGVSIDFGAGAEIRRLAVNENRLIGLHVRRPGTTVVIEDLIASNTSADSSEPEAGGRGLYVAGGATFTLDRADIEGNEGRGIYVAGSSTSASFADLTIADTRSRAVDREIGYGFHAASGAQVEVRRAALSRNRSLGLVVTGAGSVLRLRDARIEGTESEEASGELGVGLAVLEGARVEALQTIVIGNRSSGIQVGGAGSVLEGEDLIVSDTRGEEYQAAFGEGLVVTTNSTVSLRRALLEGNREVGALAISGGTLLLADVTIERTLGSERDAADGRGVAAQSGGRLVLARAIVADNREVGVFADGAQTTIDATDLQILRTESESQTLSYGQGAHAQAGATIRIERAVVEDNRNVGLLASGRGTRIVLKDAVIARTRERECVAGSCAGFGAGHGVVSVLGAKIEARRFIVADNAHVGVQVATEGEADLDQGVITGNRIGANVQTVGFDLDRLVPGVAWIDNDRDLDSEEVPIPDSDASLSLTSTATASES